MKRLITAFFVLSLTGLLITASAAGLTVTAKSGISSKCAAVMWITNAANVIQHTFAMWDKGDNTHLKTWRTYSGGTISVDAVSSATLSSGATFSGTWNLKDASGAQVPDGTYKYFIEICQDGPTPYHVAGSIVIDATSKTKAGIDSGNTTTAITNVNAVYTAPAIATNAPPVITNPDTVSAKIGSTTTWTALATDANNDPVTFTFTGQQSWITVSNATLTMNPTVTSKNDTVRVLASDGKGGFDTLNLKIFPFTPPTTNVPPVITNPDTVSAKIGVATIWTASATDLNGDAVSFTFTGQQSWITVSGATLTMNPIATSKKDTVRVLASDGKGGLDTLNLKITVFNPPPVNLPPVITNPDTISAKIGSTTTWTAHATDANGDAVSFMFTGQQSWITVSSATLTMNPTATSKNDTVMVLASDGKGGLDTLNLKIAVFNPPVINIPPVITSPAFVNAPINSITKWVAGATDANGDSVSFTFKRMPTTPTAWYSYSGDTLIIIPQSISQTCTTAVFASDGKGGTDTLNLRINVLPAQSVIGRNDVKKNFTITIGNMPFSFPAGGDNAVAVTLFSCNGTKILTRIVDPYNANKVSLAGIKPGMYLLTIRKKSATTAYKIVIGR